MKADVHTRLVWPKGRTRTPAHKRKLGPFDTRLGKATSHLAHELEMMGARYITISTDVRGYKRAGVWRPYSDEPMPSDPGVAVYWDIDGDQYCLECDKWEHVQDNMRAIGLHVAAVRGQERWGVSSTKQSFAGARLALPAAGSDWRAVLALDSDVTYDDVHRKHRELATEAHPDKGGNEHEMVRLNQALEAAKQELGS
jgi:hypothetical protein